MFKKRECKHCKLSKAVANDAAVQFNKAESALKIELLRNQFFVERIRYLEEIEKLYVQIDLQQIGTLLQMPLGTAIGSGILGGVKKLRIQNEAMAKEIGDMKFALSVNAGEWSKTSAWQIAQIHTLEKQLQESRADLALADTMVRQQRRRLIDYGEYGNKCNHPQSL